MITGIIWIILLIIIDQIVKLSTVAWIGLNETITVIPNILEFRYVQNDSAAWGLFGSVQWIFLPITLVALTAFGYFFYKADHKKQKLYSISLVLLIAGTLGNAIDRLVNSGTGGFFSGYVIDTFYLPFLEYIPKFPNFIFNVADTLLTFGIVFWAIEILFLETKRKKKYENDTNK